MTTKVVLLSKIGPIVAQCIDIHCDIISWIIIWRKELNLFDVHPFLENSLILPFFRVFQYRRMLSENKSSFTQRNFNRKEKGQFDELSFKGSLVAERNLGTVFVNSHVNNTAYWKCISGHTHIEPSCWWGYSWFLCNYYDQCAFLFCIFFSFL